MKAIALSFVTLGLLAGCASQSEALKMGDDKYQVSANASPAIAGAREIALTNANKKCDDLSKTITVFDIKNEYAFPANGVATVTFNCK